MGSGLAAWGVGLGVGARNRAGGWSVGHVGGGCCGRGAGRQRFFAAAGGGLFVSPALFFADGFEDAAAVLLDAVELLQDLGLGFLGGFLRGGKAGFDGNAIGGCADGDLEGVAVFFAGVVDFVAALGDERDEVLKQGGVAFGDEEVVSGSGTMYGG